MGRRYATGAVKFYRNVEESSYRYNDMAVK